MSRARLDEHRRLWDRKPVLAEVYHVWFDALLAQITEKARVLEVGAGPGFLAAYARRRRAELGWVATDLIDTPWNNAVADGLRLPFRSGAFDAVVGLDLVHHLARPAEFFVEAHRVLRPRGLIAVVEPWVTPLSYPIYRFLHQEGCTLGLDPWNPFGEGGDRPKEAFQGDAAIVWSLVRSTPPRKWLGLGFHPPLVKTLNGLAYVLSLGFREASLLPPRLAPLLLGIDRRLGRLAPVIGLRAIVVWEREPTEVKA